MKLHINTCYNMPKRELNIPIDKKLNSNTQEDLILKSPPPIPDPGLRDLIQMRRINGSDCSYYDISPTEQQAISNNDDLVLTIFDEDPLNVNLYSSGPQEVGGRPTSLDEQDILDKFETIMGSYNNF